MALNNDELACVYAALILADDNVDVTGDKISAILTAANYKIDDLWPKLFAGALEGVKVADLIKNIGAAPAGAAAGAATTAPAAGGDDKKGAAKEAPKKEEKKEEKPDSDDEEMVSSIAKNSPSRIFSSRVSTYSVRIHQNLQHTDMFELFIHRDKKTFSVLFHRCLCVFYR